MSSVLKSAAKETTGEVAEQVAEKAAIKAVKNASTTSWTKLNKYVLGGLGVGVGSLLVLKPDLLGNLLSQTAKDVGGAVGDGLKAAAPGVGEGISSIVKPAVDVGGNVLGAGFGAVLTSVFAQFGLTKQQGVMLVSVIIMILVLVWLIKFIKN